MTQITATLPTLDFPQEVDYPTQEDWPAFSAAAELNFRILGGSWSTQMQNWKDQANAMSIELNNNATIAQGLADYQGDWISQGYTLGQTVSLSGIYYICKLTHATGQNPTTGGSIYWNLAIGNWNLKVNNYGDESITGIKSFANKILSPNLAYKDTLVTINSWSYSGTTITLNVTSHTFIAGDYIEISGLTSTTNAPNGIYLVTSVTSTTIVFTLGATPTGTAGVSSATVKGFATINGRVSESIGVNQTWQTFFAVSGTTYYNTTGKPIVVVGQVTATGAGTIDIFITVNGVVSVKRNLYVSAAGYLVTAETIVPNGASYSITVSSGTFSTAIKLA